VGSYTVHQLAQVRFDYSFIGTGYVDSLHGLTDFDWEIVQTKKAVINASKKTILLCISEKLNSQHQYKTCDINAINTMITELDPNSNLLNPYRNQEIHLL
jgi:DeoR/GlpR family transcriptional regulator of sugar metabolism